VDSQLVTLVAVDGLGYACAVVLAAVFVRAGAAKVARPDRTAATFAALGVPAATVTARGVPALELLVAVALIAAPRVGAVAALVLLLPFTAVLGRAVRAGLATPCNCFGAARADPVSWVDVVRNAMLATLAVVALLATEPVMPDGPALLVAAVALAAGVLVLTALRRQ
jgi:uncharacterized membrane protein YphA (DoxX/SURF4 family)